MTHKILVADDVRMNRSLVIDILSRKLEDVEFFEAINGQEVIEVVKEHEIDLIMLDLIMPVMDGYETLRWLKNEERTADIPVIVNSAITEVDSIEETLRAGAIDYFTKPLSPNDMDIIVPIKVKNALQLYEQNKIIADLNKQIQKEIENANILQNIMLPKSKDLSQIDLFIKYQPSIGIGGDFFDCVEVGDAVWFMIADVTGHGIAAAMASSMVKILFRTGLKGDTKSPKEVLEEINNNVFDFFDFDSGISYLSFTGFVGCIKDGLLLYANAGQPYPVMYKGDGNEVQVLDIGGLPLGTFDNANFAEYRVEIQNGDALILYTDGLFSSGKSGDFSNWSQVHDYIKENRELILKDPEAFLDNMFWRFYFMHKEHKSEFTDDVALMLIRVK